MAKVMKLIIPMVILMMLTIVFYYTAKKVSFVTGKNIAGLANRIFS